MSMMLLLLLLLLLLLILLLQCREWRVSSLQGRISDHQDAERSEVVWLRVTACVTPLLS